MVDREIFDTWDCPNCAGSGLIRFGPQCVGSKWVPTYCADCNGTGEIRRQTEVDRQAEIDRKTEAYTAVGEMSPAEFDLLIEGSWRRPGRVVERGGQIYDRTPIEELEWTPGNPVDPYRFGISMERIKRKEEEMFTGDISPDFQPEESSYEKAQRYAKRHGGPDYSGNGVKTQTPTKKGILGQVGAIIVQGGRVARAYVRENRKV